MQYLASQEETPASQYSGQDSIGIGVDFVGVKTSSLFELLLQQRIPPAMRGTTRRRLCFQTRSSTTTNKDFLGRIIQAQLYVAAVTPALQVLGWTGPAIFSVTHLFHLAKKHEKLGLIRDVSFPSLLAARWRKVPLDVVCVSPAKTVFCFVIFLLNRLILIILMNPRGSIVYKYVVQRWVNIQKTKQTKKTKTKETKTSNTIIYNYDVLSCCNLPREL